MHKQRLAPRRPPCSPAQDALSELTNFLVWLLLQLEMVEEDQVPAEPCCARCACSAYAEPCCT